MKINIKTSEHTFEYIFEIIHRKQAQEVIKKSIIDRKSGKTTSRMSSFNKNSHTRG